MAKGDWWFKLEWDEWLNDEELSACNLEAQGFWIKCVCLMYRADTDTLTGSIDDLRRRLGVLPEELTRCCQELKRTNAATVTFGNGVVTIVSRRRTKELNLKEANRLKVERHRQKLASNPDVTEQSKSKSLKQEKEKKKDVSPQTATYVPLSELSPEEEVFLHWQAVLNLPRHTLTADRKRIIRARLKEFSPDDLKRAIDIVSRDEFLRGKNERGKQYTDFKTIFANQSKIENYLYSTVKPVVQFKNSNFAAPFDPVALGLPEIPVRNA
jgi:uncharacterized phage protein (TIGR02220 family)